MVLSTWRPSPPSARRRSGPRARRGLARWAVPDGAEAAPLVIIDVTEETFQAEVVDRSMTVPVVLDFWATWCQPCTQLSPILERLAEADGGRWVLARIDVDANQRLSSAAQVQSIPTVHVVWQGQLVPGFTGALPEPQVRAFLDQVLLLARTPRAAPAARRSTRWSGHTSTRQPTLWRPGTSTRPRRPTATLLNERPGDPDGRAGLATVALLRRTEHAEPMVVLADAEARPEDVPAQLAAADVEFAGGQVDLAVRPADRDRPSGRRSRARGRPRPPRRAVRPAAARGPAAGPGSRRAGSALF